MILVSKSTAVVALLGGITQLGRDVPDATTLGMARPPAAPSTTRDYSPRSRKEVEEMEENELQNRSNLSLKGPYFAPDLFLNR